VDLDAVVSVEFLRCRMGILFINIRFEVRIKVSW
jgi:hypothetical protein